MTCKYCHRYHTGDCLKYEAMKTEVAAMKTAELRTEVLARWCEVWKLQAKVNDYESLAESLREFLNVAERDRY